MTTDTKRVLALDLANRTGWAYLGLDGGRWFGAWDIAKAGDRHPGARLRRLRDGLVEFLDCFPANLIAYEDAQRAANNWNTAVMHAELRGIVKELACARGIELLAFYPITVKSFAGCAGKYTRQDKTAMIRACERLLGITTDDDNIADALFILELARKRPDLALSARPVKKKPRAKSPQGKLFSP